jgi:quinolinate synthase
MSYQKMTDEEIFSKLKKIELTNPSHNYTKERCKQLTPLINDILELKHKKDAIILAHSYVHPDIIYSVADYVGDSYELALKAKETSATTIIFAAVRFMAETAKIVNPKKIVIDPNPCGKCSLADGISPQEILVLRQKYPNHTFVCYINTTAKTKSLCDICVTSSNAVKIISNIPNDKIYFLPDKFMGKNISKYLRENNIEKEILYHDATCYVHEEYDKEQIDAIKQYHPTISILSHLECRPEVIAKSDFTGSTSQMIDYVKANASKDKKFMLLTECGITSRLQVELKDANIMGTCSLCRFMRNNSLVEIKNALASPFPSQVIEIDEDIIQSATTTINAMFDKKYQ